MAAGMIYNTGTTASPWYSLYETLNDPFESFTKTEPIFRYNPDHRPSKERPIRPNLSPSEMTSRLPYTLIWLERKCLRRAYIRPDFGRIARKVRQTRIQTTRPQRPYICGQKERGASSPIKL
jgi:hypothetical protein